MGYRYGRGKIEDKRKLENETRLDKKETELGKKGDNEHLDTAYE